MRILSSENVNTKYRNYSQGEQDMSRVQYLKQLERREAAAQKVIDDLTRENYELRTMLKEVKHAQSAGRSRS